MTSKRTIPDFKDSLGRWRKCVGTGSLQQRTLSYERWIHMRGRCTVGGWHQENNTSYIGCSLSKTFSNFQSFVDWSTAQVGYLEDYQLDKDILIRGNKVYGEDTCVFVPRGLNMFFIINQKSNKGLPVGTRLKHGGYESFITVEGKSQYLGMYTTPDDAHNAYKVVKEAHARRWYERLKSGEFEVDARVVERMRNFCVSDYLRGGDIG